MRAIENIWYRPPSLLTILLWPLGQLYCLLARLRRGCYRINLLSSSKPAVPVIVVGNITTGGTGKTPLVILLAQWLSKAGYHPGIVSRGYGGRTRHFPLQVLADSTPEEVGDEPLILARHSGCPVMVDPDRSRAASHMVETLSCDIILTDDGLQHYRLQRDLEIAVVDGDRQFGNQYCLPAGPLREPISRMDTVDLCITHYRTAPAKQKGHVLWLQTGNLVSLSNDTLQKDINEFVGQTVHAVAGLGNPQRFFANLQALGLNIIPHAMPDHHNYSPMDIIFNDDFQVVMTEKDAVKCRALMDSVNNKQYYWYLSVSAQTDNNFKEIFLSKVKELASG